MLLLAFPFKKLDSTNSYAQVQQVKNVEAYIYIHLSAPPKVV